MKNMTRYSATPRFWLRHGYANNDGVWKHVQLSGLY